MFTLCRVNPLIASDDMQFVAIDGDVCAYGRDPVGAVNNLKAKLGMDINAKVKVRRERESNDNDEQYGSYEAQNRTHSGRV